MRDMAQWLDGLGLGQYAVVFADNAIDEEVLADLTEAELERLGVLLGHRKKLLKAIAALRRDPVAPEAVSQKPVHIEAERRQLTVMFCDLVGSTALAARLDPEDLRELIGAYHRCATEAVERFGGYVAKYMGDGMLAYFGYPQAHEDDAERAIRAGLALVEAVGRLETLEERLRVRIGIATGLVIVGDLVGSGDAQERGVIGETPNLAARLQGLAEPDTVVIEPQTRRLLGDLFEYVDLGAIDVKGMSMPLHAYRVLRSSAVESRFEAFHAQALTPLVGRDEEIELLRRRWRGAMGGSGEVILLSGEPGIGKSRLAAAILEQIAGEAHTPLRYFCSPQQTDSALHPIINQLERAAGFEREDDPPSKLAKLGILLARTSTPPDDGRLIADLLSLPDAGRFPALDLSPQQRKQRSLEALIRQIEALARRHPVLMIFEDAHWIDPTSLELMDRMIERIRRLPVLLLMTFRPEFDPPWIGQAHVTSVALSRLDRHEGSAIIERIAGDEALSPEIVSEIVERTDGVPLFIEELTKAVLEAGAGGNALGTLASTPLPALAVPATLQASLMARLDRLGPAAKEVAQIGAVIGREFSYGLLAAVGQRPDAELRTAVGQLVEAGLAFCLGAPPQASYLFKHALVQDAAYGTLLRRRRQELHGRIVAVLEARFPDMPDQQPALLAHHCGRAGLVEKAVAYWGRAGRQSLAHSAMVEAAAQARKGLDLLPQLSDGPERWRQELDLQRILGAALLASKGNAAPETGQAYARARELCEWLEDTTALIPVLGGLSTCYQTRGEYAAMRQISEDLLRIGERRNDTVSALIGSRSMGLCLYHLGEFAAAREHLERVLSLYTPEAHHVLASVTSFDMRAAALAYLALVFRLLGYPEQAAPFSAQALSHSRDLRNPHNLAFVLNYAAASKLIARAEPAAEELLDELTALSGEHQFPVWRATAAVMRGYVLAGRDDPAEGLTLARGGWADWVATGSKWHGTYYLGLLAQTCERAGQADEAFDLLSTALEMAEGMGERWFEAELRRIQGEWLVTHRREERARAAACFHRALAVAREQKARTWELRAATSLARLWRDQGMRTEIRDLLAPVCGWFAEGLDLPDLTDARVLLDELR